MFLYTVFAISACYRFSNFRDVSYLGIGFPAGMLSHHAHLRQWQKVYNPGEESRPEVGRSGFSWTSRFGQSFALPQLFEPRKCRSSLFEAVVSDIHPLAINPPCCQVIILNPIDQPAKPAKNSVSGSVFSVETSNRITGHPAARSSSIRAFISSIAF